MPRASTYAETIAKTTGHIACITDKDSVIADMNNYGVSQAKGKTYSDIKENTLKDEIIQYINVNVYLNDTVYSGLTDDKKAEIKKQVIVNILDVEEPIFTSYCYIDVKLYDKNVNPIPESSSTYDYYSILENSKGASIEYGNSILFYKFATIKIYQDAGYKNTQSYISSICQLCRRHTKKSV